LILKIVEESSTTLTKVAVVLVTTWRLVPVPEVVTHPLKKMPCMMF